MDNKINEISGHIVDAAVKVHSHLGPGLLESVYETCLFHELSNRGLNVKIQVPVPIEYEGINLETGFRLDLLVEEKVIVELKSVEALLPIHEAQMLTYLRLSKKHLGLLINFNSKRLKDGIRRFVK